MIKKFQSGIILLAAVLCSISILSGDIFAKDQKMKFFVDHAQFRLQQNYVYLEIYYSIARQNLSYKKAEDGYHALGKIKTYIKKGESSMLVDSLFVEDFVKARNEISPTQRFAEMSAIQIEQGDYLLKTQFTDLVSSQTIEINDSLKITSFPEDRLELSNIELANSIDLEKEKQLKFDKNGLRVVPNASKTFGTGLAQLFFYAEAYNLETNGEAQGSSYHLNYFIFDANGKKIHEVCGKSKTKPGVSSIINGSLDVGFLPSGFYTLKIALTDDFTGQIAESQKNFYIYKIEDFITRKKTEQYEQADQKDEFETMTEDTLNLHFQMAQYITSQEDKVIFKHLDINGKRNFLRNFWKEHDPDLATPINEKKIQYYHLLDYANKNFSVGKKPGWKTDRARVLLIYGQPNEVERQPSSPGQKAYEIWYYYELEGGIQFVFVDLRSIHDYELVHSTQQNEVHDDEWKERYLKY